MGLFLGYLFCSIDLCVCFYAVLYCFDYYNFIMWFETWNIMPLSLFFFFKIALALCIFLWFCINFRIVCLISVKKNSIGILIGIVLNLYTALGSIDILTILILPVYEHRISFHIFVSSLVSFINVL